MKSIHFSQIVIKPNRQRQEFEPEAMQELKTSIEDRGLMHPPVLRQEGDSWVLVAGERRLKAMMEIYELGGSFKCDGDAWPAGFIPFTDLGDLTDLEAEEAELDENLRRRDLTWQEHAAAVQKLHALRTKQREQIRAEDLLEGTQEPIARQTIADTAQELTGRREGSYQSQTRKEIIVARHLDNPEIAKAKNVDEAFKILKRQEETTRNVELARTVGATFNSDLHRLFNVDCISFMSQPENAGYFDVICTDPPYGMNADQFGDAGGKMTGIEHRYDDSIESWRALMQKWCGWSFVVCKPQAHAYVFCDIDNFHELKQMMQDAGWYVFRTPLINHKVNSGRVPLPDQGPRRQYETILYAIKGKKTTTHIYPDVISCPADENLTHGAQKPVAVYSNLLQRSVRPGDRVLDAFCGSGGIFEAGNTLKCEVTGTEMNPEYYAISFKRIQALKALENPDIFAGL